jgi:flavorubredoxin
VKICIAYESKFGNGKKCADHLGNVLTKKGHNVDILNMRKVKPNKLPKADIYIFSSPTHVGNAPFKVKGFLRKLEIPQEDAKYALMTTCMDLNCKTTKTMEEHLEGKGMTKVTEDLKLKVEGMKGPLEEDYMNKIEEFASEITK